MWGWGRRKGKAFHPKRGGKGEKENKATHNAQRPITQFAN